MIRRLSFLWLLSLILILTACGDIGIQGEVLYPDEVTQRYTQQTLSPTPVVTHPAATAAIRSEATPTYTPILSPSSTPSPAIIVYFTAAPVAGHRPGDRITIEWEVQGGGTIWLCAEIMNGTQQECEFGLEREGIRTWVVNSYYWDQLHLFVDASPVPVEAFIELIPALRPPQ